MRICYTYLMTDSTYCKIGKSFNPKKRYEQILTGNANVKLLSYGIGATESDLHNDYSEFRIRGEWFDLTSSQIEDIIIRIKNTNSITKCNYKMSDSLLETFLDMEYMYLKLFLKILIKAELPNNLIADSLVLITYNNYKHICSSVSFYKAKKKFIELELLIPVKSHKKYFILNPRYVIKMYNPKNE